MKIYTYIHTHTHIYFKIFLLFIFLAVPCSMLDLSSPPTPGIEPVLPAVECRILTTGPPGKSLDIYIFNVKSSQFLNYCFKTK